MILSILLPTITILLVVIICGFIITNKKGTKKLHFVPLNVHSNPKIEFKAHYFFILVALPTVLVVLLFNICVSSAVESLLPEALRREF